MSRSPITISSVIIITCLFLVFGLTTIAKAQNNPHGNYSAATDACGACHRTHTGMGVALRASVEQGDDFCLNCHDGSGVPATAPVVSTHANVNFSGGSEASFQLTCIQCHEPHGTSNLSSIREAVIINTTLNLTTGPVVFAATSSANSFDDGNSNPVSHICVTCHINSENAGYPMAFHTGGVNHIGNFNYAGQNCIACHPHSADDDPTTLDGFMPIGGCTNCHAAAQDNGDNIPVGGRRAVVDEFGRTSHHVQGSVTDADCLVCHVMATHTNGYVQLKNVDNTIIYDEMVWGSFRADEISNTISKALQPFCLSCHDSDGAGGNTTPFSDGQTVPNIKGGTLWAESAHNTGETTNTGYGCLGDGSTSGCHATAHGSNINSLLAPSDGSSGSNNVNQEEGFCYTCHNGSTVAKDIEAEFMRTSHHDVNDGEQTANGSALECTNCHNPHRVKNSNRLSDPDNTQQLWAGTDTNFCLACHDGNPPAGVSFPTTFNGTGFDKSNYSGSSHSTNLDGYGCRHCHSEHGSTYGSLLVGQYRKSHHQTFTTSDYSLCWTCHNTSTVTADQSAFPEHRRHVVNQNSPCIHCHDVHAPYDVGEPGLINFVYGVTKMDVSLNGRTPSNYSTAFRAISGAQWGCYLLCHAQGNLNSDDHDPQPYSRGSADTIGNSCTTCHYSGGPAPVLTVQTVSPQFNIYLPIILKNFGREKSAIPATPPLPSAMNQPQKSSIYLPIIAR